jgi:hypothetical protein
VLQGFRDTSWFQKNPIMRAALWASTQAKKSLLTQGDRTPEGWASITIFEALDELETTNWRERPANPTPVPVESYANDYLSARRFPYLAH